LILVCFLFRWWLSKFNRNIWYSRSMGKILFSRTSACFGRYSFNGFYSQV